MSRGISVNELKSDLSESGYRQPINLNSRVLPAWLFEMERVARAERDPRFEYYEWKKIYRPNSNVNQSRPIRFRNEAKNKKNMLLPRASIKLKGGYVCVCVWHGLFLANPSLFFSMDDALSGLQKSYIS